MQGISSLIGQSARKEPVTKAAHPQSHTEARVDRINTALDGIFQSVRDLSGRLSSVRRSAWDPSPVSENALDSDVARATCALDASLSTVEARLESLKSQIEELRQDIAL